MDEKKKDLDVSKESVEETQDEIVEEVKEEVSEENQELEKIKDSYVRLQADFTNYRNRQEKEKQDIYKYASEKLVTKLLTVVDNLDRALSEEKEKDAFTEGIELVREDLLNILKQEGLEEIKSDGELFDANKHHAVFIEESDTVESGHIIETFQKGYTLNGKVIRASMVKVSAWPGETRRSRRRTAGRAYAKNVQWNEIWKIEVELMTLDCSVLRSNSIY